MAIGSGATIQPAPRVGVRILLVVPRWITTSGASAASDGSGRHVITQLAVVVVLDDQPTVAARAFDQRDAAARGHAAAQRVLVGGRAVDGFARRAERRRAAGPRRPPSTGRPCSPAAPNTPDRALVAGFLHGHGVAAASAPRPRSRSATAVVPPVASTGSALTARPRWRSRCSAMASRYSGRPARSGRDNGPTSAAARQARRQAARSSPPAHGAPGARSRKSVMAGTTALRERLRNGPGGVVVT